MWSSRASSPHRRALAASLVLGVSLATLGACGEDTEPTGASTASDTPSTAEDAETSETPEGEGADEGEGEGADGETDSPAPTSTTAVPVYFVGDTPRGQRLFREFRSVDADDPLVAAGALLTGDNTLDPDYGTLLPAGSFADVRQGDDGLEVVLPDDSWTTRPAGMSKQQATLAVQQVVYTLQGVVQARDELRVLVEGGNDPVDLFGVPTADGVGSRPQLEVLGLVNITTPEEATTVSGSFTASGVASSFEATVPWEVRSGGQVVLDGFATADGYLDRLYPWQTEIDVSSLPAGTYTLAASTSDPSGGEGPGPTTDTKTIVVE